VFVVPLQEQSSTTHLWWYICPFCF